MPKAKEEIRSLIKLEDQDCIDEYFKQATMFVEAIGSYSSYKSIAVSACAEYLAYQDGFKLRDY